MPEDTRSLPDDTPAAERSSQSLGHAGGASKEDTPVTQHRLDAQPNTGNIDDTPVSLHSKELPAGPQRGVSHY